MKRDLPFDATYVFFDGHCGTCHRVVRFLLKRRHRNRFRFVPLSGLSGTPFQEYISQHLKIDLNTSLVVLKNGELLCRTKAVFAIISELEFPWSFLLVLRIIPPFLADWIYNLYAKHRYKILGPAKDPDICKLLPANQRVLFPSQSPINSAVFSPRADVFLSAQWRHLVMVNFSVPRQVLAPFVPYGTELDPWNGEFFVSLVAFVFVRTSVAAMTVPICSDFEEVNLRFYVNRPLDSSLPRRRGVVFIKEIVPNPILAITARLFYGERYVYEKTQYQCEKLGDQTRLSYMWGIGDQLCRLKAEWTGAAQPLKPHSLEEFITEHYYGYTQSSSRQTLEYEVEHPRWNVFSPAHVSLEGPWKDHYPSSITQHMTQLHSAFVAEGSAVRVMKGKKIR